MYGRITVEAETSLRARRLRYCKSLRSKIVLYVGTCAFIHSMSMGLQDEQYEVACALRADRWTGTEMLQLTAEVYIRSLKRFWQLGFGDNGSLALRSNVIFESSSSTCKVMEDNSATTAGASHTSSVLCTRRAGSERT